MLQSKLITGIIGLRLALSCALTARAAELARFQVAEPLGMTWVDDRLTQEISLKLGNATIKGSDLSLTGNGQPLPAQFHARDGKLLSPDQQLRGDVAVTVLYKATIKSKQRAEFTVTSDARDGTAASAMTITRDGQTLRIANGVHELTFDQAAPLPVNRITAAGGKESLGAFAWPRGVVAAGVVDQLLESGPVRVVLRRSFSFTNPAHRYAITFDMRLGDPWIDITDQYALGKGTAITLDLRGMKPDTVYHPYAYNARTFSPGGSEEDSTLQPPQHPIATLGPIWRDIWYNGGPFAFVYNAKSPSGLGVVAYSGSDWTAPSHVSLESQNLELHGDGEKPGQVTLRIPTDAGHRRWALVVLPTDQR